MSNTHPDKMPVYEAQVRNSSYIYSPPDNPKTKTNYKKIILLIILMIISIFAFFYPNQLVFLSFVAAIVIALYQTSNPNDEIKQTTNKDKTREDILFRVYQTWIEGVLKPNLMFDSIEMGVTLKTNAVLRVSRRNKNYRLPNSSQDIEKIFVDSGKKLLILGEPGGGKTVLLLQLAEKLLGQAQHDKTMGIPIIFNLSSWSSNYKTLDEWLENELRRNYKVASKVARRWLDDGMLTVLLDGLDEIFPTENFAPGSAKQSQLNELALIRRTACIDAINKYIGDHLNSSIVICSRTGDYNALQKKLDLNFAIIITPLVKEQIVSYLDGNDYQGVRELIENETSARQMSKQPFLLAMMKSAYKGISYSDSPYSGLKLPFKRLADREYHLLNAYVEKRLRLNPHKSYSSQTLQTYLEWIAQYMNKNKMTFFRIRSLQPMWWDEKLELYYIILKWIIRIFLGLMFGFLISVIFERIWRDSAKPVFNRFYKIGSKDFKYENLKGFAKLKSIWDFRGVILGCIIANSIQEQGFFYGILSAPVVKNLINTLPNDTDFITLNIFVIFCVVIISWSTILIAIGIFSGFLMSIVIGGLNWASPNLAMMLSGIFAELSLQTMDQNINTKKHKSSRKLQKFLAYLIYPVWLILNTISFNMGVLLAFVQHIIFRLVMAIKGKIPLIEYEKVLDHCVQSSLLRKVGDQYIFRHKILMDHFVSWATNKNRAL